MPTPAPKSSQLTQANLTSHNNKNSTESTTLAKQTMKRFHQEHDQYRHFLVTGDIKGRLEQNAKRNSTNGHTSDRRPNL